MQEQIHKARPPIALEQIAQELVLLRPDTGKARNRRKQWIEESRAHRGNLGLFTAVLPGFAPPIHGFFRGTVADIGARYRYIHGARHVRAFGVGLDFLE